MSNKSDSRIYVGNLPPDVRTKDIEDIFYKYGKIRYIDLKNRKGPPFAFVEFEDALDAEDAIRGRDNYDFDGYRLRVEFQKGARGGGGSSGSGSRGSAFSRNASGGPPRRSDHRVIISGLPPTGSWQDLKDHMRVAGNVCYADVFKDGTGVVEFIHYEDAKYAVKHLDETKFRSHEGETSYVRVRLDTKRRSPSTRSGSRSRSPRSRSSSRSRGRRSGANERSSPSYSPVRRSRSRSRSRTNESERKRSRRDSKSRSRSRSRSRSAADASRSRSRSPTSQRKSKSRSPKAAEPVELNNESKDENGIANDVENQVN